jgi:hypothetical protein
VAVSVETGREYEFRYLSDKGIWINDEAADAYRMNEYGSENCLIFG